MSAINDLKKKLKTEDKELIEIIHRLENSISNLERNRIFWVKKYMNKEIPYWLKCPFCEHESHNQLSAELYVELKKLQEELKLKNGMINDALTEYSTTHSDHESRAISMANCLDESSYTSDE